MSFLRPYPLFLFQKWLAHSASFPTFLGQFHSCNVYQRAQQFNFDHGTAEPCSLSRHYDELSGRARHCRLLFCCLFHCPRVGFLGEAINVIALFRFCSLLSFVFACQRGYTLVFKTKFHIAGLPVSSHGSISISIHGTLYFTQQRCFLLETTTSFSFT